jgi:hypothetical protein
MPEFPASVALRRLAVHVSRREPRNVSDVKHTMIPVLADAASDARRRWTEGLRAQPPVSRSDHARLTSTWANIDAATGSSNITGAVATPPSIGAAIEDTAEIRARFRGGLGHGVECARRRP